MLQSNDTEKPYLLHHLIIHGVLAVAFLMVGWLFPAQYRTLHTDALAQASVVEGQTLEEFRDNLGAGTDPLSAVPLLDLAAKQLERPAPLPEKLSPLSIAPALDSYFAPARQREIANHPSSQNELVKRLLALKSQAPNYAAAITLAARLPADGQFHQDLNVI